VAAAPAGSAYQVQSPTGFAKGDMIVAIDQAGACERTKVTKVSAPDANGVVTITHTGAAQDFNASSLLFNMGPWDRVQRVRYDVAAGVLRSLDLVDPNAQPNPLASNIVNLKVQYGVDTNDDGLLDGWVSAADAPWRPDDLLKATSKVINQVKAIRIGLIVRSAQFDREITKDYDWVLFDCESHDNTCPGRLTGTIAADPKGGGYRYRIYETVVPLRNELWNRQL
jgi:type IV pilus assembly protein PilW